MSTAKRLQLGLTWRALAVATICTFAQFAAVSVLGIQPLLAQEGTNQLANIEAQSLPGNRVELRLTMTNPAPDPLAFTIDQPARIVLDLPDTGSSMDSRRKDINIGPLDTVLTAPANGRTRVVLNLDDMVPYDMRVAGNLVYVTLGVSEAKSVKAFSAPAASASASTSASATSSNVGRSIDSVDFRRTENGGGRVVVNLTDVGTPVDVRQESGRIIVDFEDTVLPSSMIKRLDVLDFATPVTTVDAVTVDGNAR
ncbi:MAG: AMIN domain-containing protein, partial [Gammaproteobacteria bacterium]